MAPFIPLRKIRATYAVFSTIDTMIRERIGAEQAGPDCTAGEHAGRHQRSYILEIPEGIDLTCIADHIRAYQEIPGDLEGVGKMAGYKDTIDDQGPDELDIVPGLESVASQQIENGPILVE